MRLPGFDDFLKRRYRRRRKPVLRVPFVGREDLLAALDARLAEATGGGQAFVALEGPAGSGKSAVLEEFLARRCRSTAVLPLVVNAADFVWAEDVFIALLAALQNRSRQITENMFRATRRLRTLKGLNWEEADFTRMIAAPGAVPTGRAAAAPASLLERVRQHPWATGAAAALDGLNRALDEARPEPRQRFVHVMGSIRERIEPGKAVMVVVIDQVEETEVDATPAESARPDWGAVAGALTETRMPALVLWAGPPEGVQPVLRSLPAAAALTTWVLDPLADDEWEYLGRQVARCLPAAVRTPWHEAPDASPDRRLPIPGFFWPPPPQWPKTAVPGRFENLFATMRRLS